MNRRALRKVRRKKRDSHVASVNLVSMIDMFIILIIYLLVNTAAVQVVGAELVELPESLAKDAPRDSVSIVISRDELLVDGHLVMTVAEARQAEDGIIEELRAKLLEKSPPTAAQQRAAAAGEPLESGEVNVLADKSVSFSLLKRVMSSCTAAQFGNIALGVLPKDGPQ